MDNKSYPGNNGFNNGAPSFQGNGNMNNQFNNPMNGNMGNNRNGKQPFQAPNNGMPGRMNNQPRLNNGQGPRPNQPMSSQPNMPGRMNGQPNMPGRMNGQPNGNMQRNNHMNDVNKLVQTGRIPADVINDMVQTGRIPTELIASISEQENRNNTGRPQGQVPPRTDQARPRMPQGQPGMNVSSPNVAGARGNMPPASLRGRQPMPPADGAKKPPMPPQPPRPQIAMPSPQGARPVGPQGARPVPPQGTRPVAGAQPPMVGPDVHIDNGYGRRKKQKSSTALVVVLVVLMILATGAYITKGIWMDKVKGNVRDAIQNTQVNSNNNGESLASDEPTAPAGPFYVTIYYKPFFKKYKKVNIHYQAGTADWTAEPGVEMESCTDKDGFLYKYTIELANKGDIATVCFNNGTGLWDSNDGRNYSLLEGTYGIADKTCYIMDQSEITFVDDSVNVYYFGFESPYIHYLQDSKGTWTDLPGVPMESLAYSVTSIFGKQFTHKYTIPMNGLDMIELCFQDGNNHWDKDNGENYKFDSGTYLVIQNSGFTKYLPIDKYVPTKE